MRTGAGGLRRAPPAEDEVPWPHRAGAAGQQRGGPSRPGLGTEAVQARPETQVPTGSLTRAPTACKANLKGTDASRWSPGSGGDRGRWPRAAGQSSTRAQELNT